MLLDNVVIVGDSHSVGPPGQYLEQYLRTVGAKSVTILGRIGRSSTHLVQLESQVLNQALALKPTLLLYFLGTNDRPSANLQRAYQTMHDRAVAAGSQTWLIGPPAFALTSHDSDGTNYAQAAVDIVKIGQSVFGQQFIDSRPITANILTTTAGREPDGVHFKPAGGRIWARGVVQRLTQPGRDARSSGFRRVVEVYLEIVSLGWLGRSG